MATIEQLNADLAQKRAAKAALERITVAGFKSEKPETKAQINNFMAQAKAALADTGHEIPTLLGMDSEHRAKALIDALKAAIIPESDQLGRILSGKEQEDGGAPPAPPEPKPPASAEELETGIARKEVMQADLMSGKLERLTTPIELLQELGHETPERVTKALDLFVKQSKLVQEREGTEAEAAAVDALSEFYEELRRAVLTWMDDAITSEKKSLAAMKAAEAPPEPPPTPPPAPPPTITAGVGIMAPPPDEKDLAGKIKQAVDNGCTFKPPLTPSEKATVDKVAKGQLSGATKQMERILQRLKAPCPPAKEQASLRQAERTRLAQSEQAERRAAGRVVVHPVPIARHGGMTKPII